MRRSRLIQRRDSGGRQEVGTEEETDFVLDICQATIVEGAKDVVQKLESAGVHARPPLLVRPLVRPPARPQGMRPMPVWALPRPPVGRPGLFVELAAIAEDTECGDKREAVARADGRDGRELLAILGEVAGDFPSTPAQERAPLPDARFSLG
ncbi:hypothetical protein K488DRAFT_92411 [Vararia minispora EC-137]|uniref:Uncharacterized protein n=1 Tax=Vararia minispora EC-137 TaxID=1314806 RepID=A0ACB8Q456_9AGAM|nr:hypothetical protein K488DRAFT_92411 [Vararia minispora EC-137]